MTDEIVPVPASLAYDPATDTLLVRVPAAEGEGDVPLLALDLKPLSADDKQRLSHIRPPEQAQRPPGAGQVSRPAGQ